MNQQELKQALSFVGDLAVRVGDFLLTNQHKISVLNYKDKQDVLTNIDLEAEQIILEALEKKYPTHSIFSEEKGLVDKNSEYKWVIDPLDGTKHYIRQIPIYNTAIALTHNDEVVLGVSYRPVEDQMYAAIKNGGFFFNEKKCHVSENEDLKKSFIFLNFPNCEMEKQAFDKSMKQVASITWNCYRVRPFIDSFMGMGYVARGAFDGFAVFFQEHLWDVLPAILFVKEAGGKVTDFDGKPVDTIDIPHGMLATNGKVHEKILELLKNV